MLKAKLETLGLTAEDFSLASKFHDVNRDLENILNPKTIVILGDKKRDKYIEIFSLNKPNEHIIQDFAELCKLYIQMGEQEKFINILP